MDNKGTTSSRDESYQPIIPGLPDDLAMRCLAKLSHGYHGLLEVVCSRWRSLIRSSEYACAKAQEGWSGNWLFVLTEEQIKGPWNVYDPEADRWHPLPPIPWANSNQRHLGFSCVCVAKKFLVIGGYYTPSDALGQLKKFTATNDVIQFDPFSKQWSKVASMRVARSNFACAVAHGKVYVAGGCNLSSAITLTHAEVYDPVEDRWQEIPPMSIAREDCVGFSSGGFFYVVAGTDNREEQKTAEIFDPVKGSWYSQQNFWLFFRIMPCPVTTVEDCIYIIDDWDGNNVKYWDALSGCWVNIGPVPSVRFSDISHAPKGFGFGLIGFRNDLYVIGGKVLKWEPSDGHWRNVEIVKLNVVRICKLSGRQPEWREVRSIRGSHGAVVGCAVLEE
uniref:TSA: Wollemia nobilis Ref_Wollemi_Transcript_15188_1284 transcribed RNA sequence n=1 Tax=Wollemia nobilis TaxID=56998 RepID=A0A0C9S6B9_9CONI